MAFPVVESVTATVFGAAATAHLVNMPPTVAEGDLLLANFSNDGTATVTTPAGWSLLGNALANGDSDRLSVYGKRADGTEGGTTVDFVTSVAETAVAQVYRIIGWGGVVASHVQLGTFVTGSSANPDPPSLSPSWGAEDTLWIALTNHFREGRTVDVYPASYTDGVQTEAGSQVNGTSLESARRVLNAVSEDPGTFTISSTVSWAANTVAIRPAAGNPSVVLNTEVLIARDEVLGY